MAITHAVKKWWKSANVYQIYPASFYDSNGDGVGDIPGIISKLDYLASLGIDIIWVSPVYDSPQVDMGYDISNYNDIYAPYGTLQDAENLIREVHSRGMRLMMDLVINHTSDRHAWFQESRSSRDSRKRDWYIWRPAKTCPTTGKRIPPNNWRCSFGGGSAWEWDEQTQEYYLHIWAKEQPDLNWDNAETREAIYTSAIKFWLDRGVDGFRIDTVNMYSKPQQDFPDAPVTDPKAPYQPATSLYCNGPRMHEYLSEMRQIFDAYGAITVGELLDTYHNADVLPYVSAQAKQLDMVFQFDAVEVGWGTTHKYETTYKNWTLPQFKTEISKIQELMDGTDAWSTVFLENHDLSRSVSRLANDSPQYRVAGAKLLALLQVCLSGTLYLYQGQEIGMINAAKDTYPLEYYEDVSSRLFVEMVEERHGADNKVEMDKAFTALQHLARDHSRIPMAWNGNPNGGFSDATKQPKEPWMRPHPLVQEINVASQLKDPNSVLAFWRKMLSMRREHGDLFVYGRYLCLDINDPNLFAFEKVAQDGKSKAIVVLNFSTNQLHWKASKDDYHSTLSTIGNDGGHAPLDPFEGRVYFYKLD